MALSADRQAAAYRDGELFTAPVAAGARIYAGGIVVANDDGYVEPGKAGAGLAYLGRAEAAADNAGGADGAKTVPVRRGRAHRWENSATDPVTQASLGRLCYVADDETVARTSGGGSRSAAGVVIGIEGSDAPQGAGVWVAGEHVAELRHVITHTESIDFPGIAARGVSDRTVSIAGAQVGDVVVVGLPAAAQAGLVFDARVSEAGKVKVRAQNIASAQIDAASADYKITIVRG